MSRFNQFISMVVAKFGLADLGAWGLPSDAANRLRRGQIRSTIEEMRVMLLGNTLFAPALSFQAWNTGRNELVVAWTVVAVVFAWSKFLVWRTTYHTEGSVADLRGFLLQVFYNSLIWTVGMALFYPVVEGDQKAVIATIVAGSLALGTIGFSRTPMAGVVYLGVQTIGNTLVMLTCGLVYGSATDITLSILMFAAGISLFNACLKAAQTAMIAFKNHERLSEKSEVVELLLKDYEAQATEWLWQTDQYGRLLSAPAGILEMCAQGEQNPEAVELFDLLASTCTAEAAEDMARLQKAVRNRIEFHDIRLSIQDPRDDTLHWILMKGRPQYERGGFRGFRGIFADATAEVEAERKVQFLASYDGLTNLLNRNSVQKKLCELQAEKDQVVALLVDLDGFKQVNDSYGHHTGDLLLKAVSVRLQESIGADAWAARLGGDEFLVLLSNDPPKSTEEISWIAQSICERLSEVVQLEDFVIQISASIGIAKFPEDTQKGVELLSLSDMALYEAKGSGRDRITFFDAEMQNRLSERLAIVERLKKAVRSGEIEPYYQSQHALQNGRLVGFEALARWNDADLGFVGPDVFIPIAEQTGLIVELGEHLLRRACQDACHWAELLPANPPVVSVNFSPVQFVRTDVTGLVSRVLHETGLAPELLEVEVTEGVLITSKEKIAATLRELSELGVSIALDDFGTGYSSLSYLKELPLNRLKIDQSFVRDLSEVAASPIVSTITQLGHNLGLSVIAEGVEGQSQVQILSQLGCDDAQGYLYSRPMTKSVTDKYVSERASQVSGQ